MSVSEEFRRLLLHAAERLREEEGRVDAAFQRLHERAVDSTEGKRALIQRASYLTANTYALLVMEMTARFLADDESADEPTKIDTEGAAT